MTEEERGLFQKAEELAELPSLEDTLEFFFFHSGSVEFVRDKDVHKFEFPQVFFLIIIIQPPLCFNLPEDEQEIFQQMADRSNPKAKVSYLLSHADEMIKMAKCEQILTNIFKRQCVLAFLVNNITEIRDVSFICGLLNNFQILQSYYVPQEDPGSRTTALSLWGLTQDNTKLIINAFSYILVCCSITELGFQVSKKAPYIYLKTSESQDWNWSGIINKLVNGPKFFLTFFAMIYEIKPLIYFNIVYLLSGILAVMVHPFWNSANQTIVYHRYTAISAVIDAVIYTRVPLFLTLYLWAGLQFIFTVISYNSFWEDWKDSDINYCQNLFDCYLIHWDANLKADGGAAGFAEETVGAENWMKMSRYIYFAILNQLFAVIFINIFAGIIIDKFSALRAEEGDRMEDINEVCFICGETKEIFERYNIPGGFEVHVGLDHHLWNYIYFIAHLIDKEPTEYTGNETYLGDLQNNKDSSWIPSGKSISIIQFTPNTDFAAEENQKIRFGTQRIKLVSQDLVTSATEAQK